MPDPITEAIAQRVAELLRAQPAVRLLSIEAAAKYLGRSAPGVRHLINAGTLRAVRIDTRVMLDIQDLDLLIKSAKT